ncbi:MAG TPA: TIGR03435 family protein [Candidatus Acidoferrales bacterium]|nr:TIGR03435 family protein [Candidatus Acidoferrales bacterium]HXK04270.1 TIGR03435 family protein [Verrucomicrobiae bacterium]
MLLSRILAVALVALAAWAQPLKFDVASVKKLNTTGPPGDIPRNADPAPGHFHMTNVPMRMLLEWAYDLKDYQISGPDWIKIDERYEVIAKAAGPAPESEVRQMLQSLLLERFQMKVHRETRELPVYVLLPGKGAPKVKEVAADVQPTGRGDGTSVTFVGQPISRFTFMLSRRMDRPVLDMSGLTGRYEYTVDTSGLGFNGREPEVPGGTSIFTAVQRDLNLRLEARKEPIQILVIDSISKVPTEN